MGSYPKPYVSNNTKPVRQNIAKKRRKKTNKKTITSKITKKGLKRNKNSSGSGNFEPK